MNVTESRFTLANEDELLRQVQAGDLRAYEPLVDTYLPQIRAFLALRSPAAHLVDELAHETFVFAFQRMHEFTIGTSFAKWLRSIAWNLLRAELLRFSREQSNQHRLMDHWRLEHLENAPDSGRQEVDVLRECLGKLPDPLRQLVRLKYEEDHSGDEIAARLQRSADWVWTMLFRARRRLRECIESKLKREAPSC